MLNRNRAIAVTLAAAMVFASFTTGCKPKKKNNDRLIKKCTSEVDDYMMYLTRGKFEKLSKYIAPEEDPLQNLDSLPSSEKALSLTYISLLEYSIGETIIEDETATVIMTLTYPSAEGFAEEYPEPDNLQTILTDLRSFDETDEIDVEIILSCDEEEETCQLEDTTTVNDVVSEQVEIIKDLIPDNSQLAKKDIERFMDALISINTDYIVEHSSALDSFYFDDEFMPLYTAQTSLWSYEIECGPIENEDEVSFTLHMHIKDREAVKEFFTTPETLAPVCHSFFSALVDPVPYTDPDDHLDVLSLVPGFKSYLEKAPTVDIDLQGILQYDEKDHSDFYIIINMEDVLPYDNPFEFTSDLTEEQVQEVYRAGYKTMYEDGKLTDEQYQEFQRALGETDFDRDSILSILEKHGFTTSDKEFFDDMNSYVHDNRTTIMLSEDDMRLDAFAEMYLIWASIYDDLDNDREQFDGELSGDCLDLIFEGDMKIDTKKEPAYFRLFVVDSRIFMILIPEPTDEKMELVNEILKEAGLN